MCTGTANLIPATGSASYIEHSNYHALRDMHFMQYRSDI
jgi:hypothetical protein